MYSRPVHKLFCPRVPLGCVLTHLPSKLVPQLSFQLGGRAIPVPSYLERIRFIGGIYPRSNLTSDFSLRLRYVILSLTREIRNPCMGRAV